MGRRCSYFGCFLIGVFDVVAMLLSIKVRELQNQAKHLSSIHECKEQSEYATMVVRFAAVLLSLAEAIAFLVAIFGAFTKNDNDITKGPHYRKLSVASFICTLVIFIICMVLLRVHVKERNVESSCNFKSHSYAIFGGIGCIVHALFGIATYFTSADATS